MSTQNENNISSAATGSAKLVPSSANIQSTISAIRSIAKTKELEQKVERLNQQQRFSPLPGLNAERLIAQQAALAAGSSSSVSGSPRDEDKDPGGVTDKAGDTAGDAASKAGTDVFDDGTKQPGSDQSTDKSDQDKASDSNVTDTVVSSGIYAAKDVLSDIGPYPSEKGDPNAPRIREIIGEIAGKTVKAILRELTEYDNVPVGWDDADTGALKPGWEYFEQGYYWQVVGYATEFVHRSPIPQDDIFNYLFLQYFSPGLTNIQGDGGAGTSGESSGIVQTVTDIAYMEAGSTWNEVTAANSGFYRRVTGTNKITGEVQYHYLTFLIQHLPCSSLLPEIPEACLFINPEREDEFPITGIVGLGWNGERWGVHLYDSEGKLVMQGKSSVLQMKSGGKGYELGPTRSGGYYFTPTEVQAGTTPAMLIRKDGTVQGIIDKNVLPYYTGANINTQSDKGYIYSPHLI